MANTFLLAILLTCGLLAAGLALRATLRPLQVLYIPASVVAGLLGFALMQWMIRQGATQSAATNISKELSDWPKWLIAVVFAGLLLEKPSNRSAGEAIRRGSRSAILAWIIILGQIVIGLLVFLVAVRPFHSEVPASFGQLLEVSWAGGFGSAAAMGQVYDKLGFPEGKDLAFFLATIGLVYGVLSGLVLVNLALRRGWTRSSSAGGRIAAVTGLEPRRDSPPSAFAKTRCEVMDPLALQVVILAAAFGVGYGLQQLCIAGAAALTEHWGADAAWRPANFVSSLPLFLFALMGGWCVRIVMQRLRIDDLIDRASIQRLVGVAMEFLIVSAVMSLRIEAFQAYMLAVILLVVLAAGWTVFCLLVLARRLLPREYWFELGLLNYGFATANTPQGLMLLRIIEPDLSSGAAEDYALAAPLSAPFVGGGVLTIAAMPLVLQRVPAAWVACILVAVMLGLYLFGRRLAKAAG